MMRSSRLGWERRSVSRGSSVGMLAFWLHLPAILVLVSSAHAQATYRCVDSRGQLIVGQGVAPALCRQEGIVTPQAVLDRPVTAGELGEITQYLDVKLAEFVARKQACGDRHERIEVDKDDTLDAIDERSDNRRNGRVSRGEKRAGRSVEASAERAHVTAKHCELDADNQIAEVRSVLNNPAKLRAQVPALRAEKFRHEQTAARRREGDQAAARAEEERRRVGAREADERRFAEERQQGEVVRRELLGLLEDSRGASEGLIAGSYDAFAPRLRAIDQRIRSLRGS